MDEKSNLLKESFLPILSLIQAVVLIRFFGLYNTGTFFLILSVVKLLSKPISGLSKSIDYTIISSGQQRKYFSLIGILFFLIYTASTIGLIYTTAFSILIEKFGRDIIISSIVLLTSVNYYHLLRGISRREQTNTIQILRYLFSLFAFVGIIYLGLGFYLVIIGTGISYIISALPLLFKTGISINTPKISEVATLLKQLPVTIIGSLSSNFHQYLDMIVLGVIVSIDAVGTYAAALRVVMVAIIIPILLLRGYDKVGDEIEIRKYMLKEIPTVGLISAAITPFIVFFSPQIVEIVYNTNLNSIIESVALLSILQLLASYRIVTNYGFRKMQKSKIIFLTRIGALLFNAPLSLILGYIYGLSGVIIASISVEAIMLITYFIGIRSTVGRIKITPIFVQIAGGITIYLLLVQSLRIGKDPLLFGGLGIIIYFILYWIMCPSERQDVIQIVKDIL